MHSESFGNQVTSYFLQLQTDWDLPEGFELIKPFEDVETIDVFTRFYQAYFDDSQERTLILGINPGRHGAGVTGIPFTDPVILNQIGVNNTMHQRHELSAIYVYEFIEAFGGPSKFYNHFYINSVCPLGFLRNGINVNYYDDKQLYAAVKPYIVDGIKSQIAFGCRTDVVISLGMGQNAKFLKKINQEYEFFDRVEALPHPRWVMQYRRKRKEEFIDQALEVFNSYSQ